MVESLFLEIKGLIDFVVKVFVWYYVIYYLEWKQKVFEIFENFGEFLLCFLFSFLWIIVFVLFNIKLMKLFKVKEKEQSLSFF